MSSISGQECAGTKVGVDARKLSVVEGIEGFPTELYSLRFRDRELLVKPHVEIRTVGKVQKVSRCIAKGETAGSRKRAGIEKQRSRPWGGCS